MYAPTIAERLGDRHGPTFSFEYFPPQDAAGAFTLLDTVANLRELRPDWVSVTYGATGATRQRTFDAVHAAVFKTRADHRTVFLSSSANSRPPSGV